MLRKVKNMSSVDIDYEFINNMITGHIKDYNNMAYSILPILHNASDTNWGIEGYSLEKTINTDLCQYDFIVGFITLNYPELINTNFYVWNTLHNLLVAPVVYSTTNTDYNFIDCLVNGYIGFKIGMKNNNSLKLNMGIYQPNSHLINNCGICILGLKKNFKINTPKIININKFRGNYSKITNIDSNYMSYPLINKNNLRREVA